jgi:tetratricopeptide (TPR) repeat protein
MATMEQHEGNTSHARKKSDAIVRAELHEMVRSRTFAQGSRLARFLSFTVESYLRGETQRLKESVIGVEVYDRPPDYDPKVDSIVRTEARRLRKKLQEYYEGEGRYSRVIITIPTGGYIPQVELRPQPVLTLPVADPGPDKNETVPGPLPSIKFRFWAIVLLAVVTCGIGSWSITRYFRRRSEAKLAARHAVNPQAYQAYLEGRFYWAKRTPDSVDKAISRFEEALRIDPNYAQAYAGLADSYAVTASGLPSSDRGMKAKSAAERAIALDGSSAEAETSLAFILYKFEWNWTEAERHFRRALQLNPNYALAHHWFGEFLVLRGRSDEGLAELRRAESLDPLSLPIKNDLARALYRARRYDEAIAGAQHVLELDPTFSNAYATLVYANEQKHDYPRAVEADLQVLRLSKKSPEQIEALRNKFSHSGWQAYWAGELDLLQKEPAGSVSDYVFAEVYLRLGNREQALHFLENSFADRGDAPLLVGVEPLWDPLRSESRFIYLLRRTGLQ